MDGEKKEPRHQVSVKTGWQQLVFPESPQAEFPFFLSSHPLENLTTNHQHAFNSPTNSGEEPIY